MVLRGLCYSGMLRNVRWWANSDKCALLNVLGAGKRTRLLSDVGSQRRIRNNNNNNNDEKHLVLDLCVSEIVSDLSSLTIFFAGYFRKA